MNLRGTSYPVMVVQGVRVFFVESGKKETKSGAQDDSS
jgi:hypothetical protein